MSKHIEPSHTPGTPVTLRSGKVLTYGLYPNPDHHRGIPTGAPGIATILGRSHAAVRAYDGKVWVRVDGAYGPTGDWFHARTAEFVPHAATDRAGAGLCPACGAADTQAHDLGDEFLVCASCCEIRYADAARELADRVG